jgi:hypothetical protein
MNVIAAATCLAVTMFLKMKLYFFAGIFVSKVNNIWPGIVELIMTANEIKKPQHIDK